MKHAREPMIRMGCATRRLSAPTWGGLRRATVPWALGSAVASLSIRPVRATLPRRPPPLSTLATPTMSTLQQPVLVLHLQELREEWLQEYSSPQPQPQRQPHKRASPMWRYQATTQCTDGRSTRQPPRLSRSGLTLSSLTLLHQKWEPVRMNR